MKNFNLECTKGVALKWDRMQKKTLEKKQLKNEPLKEENETRDRVQKRYGLSLRYGYQKREIKGTSLRKGTDLIKGNV